MKVYITGASGFVGRHVLTAALDAGHEVRAVVRPASDPNVIETGPEVEVVRVDLRDRTGLVDSLKGVDVVIHLAASKAGDFHTQFSGTVTATENLLAAMARAEVHNLVGVSTFSVYDYGALKPRSVLDESCPIDSNPIQRDEYAQTKLLQEDLFRRFRGGPNQVVILRPAMIYGPDNLWHALLGADLGPRFARIGFKATLPLTYVENCAEAMVMAAEAIAQPGSPIDGEVINIVDDDLPSQSSYAKSVSARIQTPPTIPVPWPVVDRASRLLQFANRAALGGRAKFPGIAVPQRLQARFKPLRYTNQKAKTLLGWEPSHNLSQAIDKSSALDRSRLPIDEPTGAAPPKLGYVTGCFPRVSDTWIQREIAGLNRCGFEVKAFSVRHPGSEHLVGAEQRLVEEQTTYLLPSLTPTRLVRGIFQVARHSPGRLVDGGRLAWTSRRVGLRGSLYQAVYLAEALNLAFEARRVGIDHLHNHLADSSCTVTMLASALSGIPYSFTIHGPAIFFDANTWRLDLKIDRAAFVNTISTYCRAQTCLFTDPTRYHKLHIVHCGVEPGRYRQRIHHGQGTRLLFIGRLVEAKGLGVLFEAVAELVNHYPALTLTLVGDGPERAELKARAAQLGLDGRVRFVGNANQSEVADHLASADVFVLPSFAEGLPVVLMEAMAAGVPPVATRIAGVSDLVEDGVNGFLVAPTDAAALAQRIRLLIDDPMLRNRLARAGRRTVELDYDSNIEAARLAGLFAADSSRSRTSIRPSPLRVAVRSVEVSATR